MLQVRKTKYPACKQIKNMSENLKNKFKEVVNIQMIVFAHTSGNNHLWFWLSVNGVFAGNFETWERLQLKYKELMRRKGD